MGQWVAKFRCKIKLKDGRIVDLMPGQAMPLDVERSPNNIHLWFDYIQETPEGTITIRGIEDVTEKLKPVPKVAPVVIEPEIELDSELEIKSIKKSKLSEILGKKKPAVVVEEDE